MTKNNHQREKSGRRAGLILLLTNIILFLGKYFVGVISGSVAIMADAINNLTDTASALAAIIGFQVAMRPGDANHPHGHGRAEYISGFIIACLIILAGLALGRSAILRLLGGPSDLHLSGLVIAVPAVAIAVKLALAVYLFRLERHMHSATIKATRLDCLSDALVTASTLLTVLLAPFTSLPLDAAVALAVAALIIYNGVVAFFENVSLLLGGGLSVADKQKLSALVDDYPEFDQIASIITNDFGPQNFVVVLGLKPNQKYSLAALQRAADKLSAQLSKEFTFQVIVYYRT
jgi:cation diffusion facilitator family transporter